MNYSITTAAVMQEEIYIENDFLTGFFQLSSPIGDAEHEFVIGTGAIHHVQQLRDRLCGGRRAQNAVDVTHAVALRFAQQQLGAAGLALLQVEGRGDRGFRSTYETEEDHSSIR